MEQADKPNGAGLSKSKKIRLMLSKSSLLFSEIAGIAETTTAYVRNIDYDVRSGGGMQRASACYRKHNPNKRSLRFIDPVHRNAQKRKWASRHRNGVRDMATKYYGKSKDVVRFSHRKGWTLKEDEILLTDSGETSDLDLAKRLGRSLKAIQAHRHVLRQTHVGVIDVRTAIPKRGS